MKFERTSSFERTSKFVAFVLALVAIWLLARPTLAQYSVPCYREMGGEKWVATVLGGTGCEWEMKTGSTLDIQSGNTTTFANNPTFSGAPVFTAAPVFSGLPVFNGGISVAGGDVTAGADLNVSAQTLITATHGVPITPTGAYQPISSAGTITPTIATSGITTGQMLVLINTTNTNIHFADTGTAKLSAQIILGQYDSLTLIFDGTNWIQLSTSNN